jgi:hypothetical protein
MGKLLSMIHVWIETRKGKIQNSRLIAMSDALDILAMIHALYTTVHTTQSHQECQTNRFIDSIFCLIDR